MRKFVSFSLTLMLLFAMIPMNVSVLTVFAAAGGSSSGGGFIPLDEASTPGPFTLIYAPSTTSPAFPKIDMSSPGAFVSPYHFHGAAPDAVIGLNDNDPVTVTGRSDVLLLGLHLRGYTFQGWTEEEDWTAGDYLYEDGDPIIISGASVMLYSVWALDDSTTPGAMNKTYKVEYDRNGGSGTTPVGLSGLENFQHFTPAIIEGNALSKEGYVFLGWSQNKDAALPDPLLGGTYAIEDQNDMTLYAVWNEGTYNNLYASVQGETNAAAAYRAFAEKAYQEGYPVIARLFLATADAEAKHADDEWAILKDMGATDRPIAKAPVVSTTAVNLKAAFDGETYEYTTMYPDFLDAAKAEAEGLTGAALTAVQSAVRIFTLAGKAEQVHAQNYKDVLDNFDDQDYINDKYKVVYRCFVCGEVVTERPANCPICGVAGSSFIAYGVSYTVNFDLNGGTQTGGGELIQTVAEGDAAVAPTVVRSNYRFNGWSGAINNITANLTVSALWTPAGSLGGSGGSGNLGGGSSVSVGTTEPSTPWIPEDLSGLYSDVSAFEWFYDAVRFATERGLMTGTGSGQFSPNTTMTRAMLVTVLYRLEGSPIVSGSIPFSDVGGGQWYSDAILWANENNVVEGYADGRFGPNDPVTREQAVTILYRFAAAKGLNVSASADLSVFDDMNQISDWAATAMSWAVAEGIIQGRTATTAAPSGISTRAEVATILKRYIEDFMSKASDTGEAALEDSQTPTDNTDDTESDEGDDTSNTEE